MPTTSMSSNSENKEFQHDPNSDLEAGPYQSAQDTARVEQETAAKDEEKSKPGADAAPEPQQNRPHHSLWSSDLRQERNKVLTKFGLIYALFGVLVLGIFSIYWGSSYQRLGRLKNLRMLVVIEDDVQIENVPPYIGDQFVDVLKTPQAEELGGWDIHYGTKFREQALHHNNNSVEQEIERLVHQQHYWASFYVKGNASYNYYQAVLNGDTSYNVSNSSIVSIYETGRDISGMTSYVIPSIQAVADMWLASSSNATTHITNLIDGNFSRKSIEVINTPLGINFYDRIPLLDFTLTAPAQVGLIYQIIVSFFQVSFFADTHKEVSELHLKPIHYNIYRTVSSICSFLFISLFFSLVNLAMQIDFTKAFGKSGFLVYWMISFLTIWAVGLVNEIAAMLLLLVYPPVVGFWLLFWVIINISSTFTPLALCPEFFRYGYALPIHNSYEASKVVFFNTYKGQLGRNIGILVAWCVILTAVLPSVSRFFGTTMVKRAKAAAAAKKDKQN